MGKTRTSRHTRSMHDLGAEGVEERDICAAGGGERERFDERCGSAGMAGEQVYGVCC